MSQSRNEAMMEFQKKLELLGKGIALKKGEAPLKELADLGAGLGWTYNIGGVSQVGRAIGNFNDYAVQFNSTNGTGYASSWPAWAYEQAKLALTTGKKLIVFANGDPFGANLLSVSVFDASVPL